MLKKFISYFFSLERTFYQKSVDAYFERNLSKDIKVFQRLHPTDGFGRSIAQHKCQVYPFKREVLLLNSMAFFMTPVVMVMLLLKKQSLIRNIKDSTIVFYNCFNLPGAMPKALSCNDMTVLKNSECPYYLKLVDIPFLLHFFCRSFGHPFLAFRVMSKVAKYRCLLDSFNKLEVIAITGEFQDTASAMTKYCHENGIKHYDFMQGEAFGSPRSSFFHFDKCFVWDEHYKDMFIGFGASPEQFEVSLPQCLQKIDGNHNEQTVDYTYYLAGDPDEELCIIGAALKKIAAKGFVCEVRPHPRWSDMDKVRKEFEGITIQDTKSVNIDQSILQTKNAISLYSTVLLQAFYNDVNVVIDDLSNPDKFNMLEGYQYIMLNKPHQLLSEITQ